MKITRLTLKNFRQFFGEQSLNFSEDEERNVTVVHGANGTGKTSLLNAFKWCFYGRTDFDTGEMYIANDLALRNLNDGGSVDTEVSVRFLHEEVEWNLKRCQRFSSSGVPGGESELILGSFDPDTGEYLTERHPKSKIQEILPQDLQPYFFFNGERIELISSVNQEDEVRDAIRRILGVDELERAERHITAAKRKFEKKVNSSLPDEQRDLADEATDLQANIDELKETKKALEREHKQARSELSSISKELIKFEAARTLEARRNELERQISDNIDRLNDLDARSKENLNQYGFLAASDKLFRTAQICVEKHRAKGELPFGIKQTFVKDLLETDTCICGRTISGDPSAESKLEETLKKSTTETMEQAVSSIGSLVDFREQQVEAYVAAKKRMDLDRENLFKEGQRLRSEFKEVSAQFTALDHETVNKLTERRDITERNKDELGMKIAEVKTSLEARLKELASLELKLKNFGEMEKSSSRFASAVARATRLSEAAEELKVALTEKVRLDLSERFNDVFQKIIRKSVRAEIDSDFKLQVFKGVGGSETNHDGQVMNEYEQSTGEKQVTSLAFIASMIASAKENYRTNKSRTYFKGGLFPLVMDSPFGSLDQDYRAKIAESVGVLADQVIVFVSNSQWEGQVESALRGRIGKEWKLSFVSSEFDHGDKPYQGGAMGYSRIVEIQ
jgi:DNA sulfur modification protein DndD